MDKITEIMGVRLNLVGKSVLMDRITEYLHDDRLDVILFADSGMIMDAAERKVYAANFIDSLMILPAETALFSRKELADHREDRIMIGQDGLNQILHCGEQQGISLYMVGDNEKDIRDFMECCKVHYKGINVTGAYYVEPNLSEDLRVSDEIIVNEINANDTDILVVMMSSPKQEEWIRQNKTLLRAKICLGIGSVRKPYLCFYRVKNGVARPLWFRKLHYYFMSGMKLRTKHRRRILNKKIAQYMEETKK